MPPGSDADSVYAAITRIRVRDGRLRIKLDLAALMLEDEVEADVVERAHYIDPPATIESDDLRITIQAQAIRRGKTLHASATLVDDAERRRALADLVRKSHALLTRLNASPMATERHGEMTVPVMNGVGSVWQSGCLRRIFRRCCCRARRRTIYCQRYS